MFFSREQDLCGLVPAAAVATLVAMRRRRRRWRRRRRRRRGRGTPAGSAVTVTIKGVAIAGIDGAVDAPAAVSFAGAGHGHLGQVLRHKQGPCRSEATARIATLVAVGFAADATAAAAQGTIASSTIASGSTTAGGSAILIDLSGAISENNNAIAVTMSAFRVSIGYRFSWAAGNVTVLLHAASARAPGTVLLSEYVEVCDNAAESVLEYADTLVHEVVQFTTLG